MSAAMGQFHPSMVKEALCKHFDLPSQKSRLSIQNLNFLGLGGGEIHYYRFLISDGRVTRSAFGKTTPKNEREYDALQYLTRRLTKDNRATSRAIALLQSNDYSLLLLEYLEGYTSALSIRNILAFLPNPASNITRLGKAIVDEIYHLQKQFGFTYSPVRPHDTDELPGQPQPTGVLEQLKQITALDDQAKAAVRVTLDAFLADGTAVRRGLVHGQMGLRNIMLRGTRIVFIDWEYMQPHGLCIYDACYMATMLLMRSAQLLLPRFVLDRIGDSVFAHIHRCENCLAPADKKEFVGKSVWFGKSLAMIDTLWQYERALSGRAATLLGCTHRKIRYLVSQLAQGTEREGIKP
jgi:hypothetical protein